jgi:hypothetical protein
MPSTVARKPRAAVAHRVALTFTATPDEHLLLDAIARAP